GMANEHKTSVTVTCRAPPPPTVTLKKNNTVQGTVAAGGSFNGPVGVPVTNGPPPSTVTDTVPAGLTIGTVTDDAASISCNVVAQTVTCALSSTPTGSYTVTIPVTAPDGTPASECTSYNNTVSVTAGHGIGNQAQNSVT